MEPEQKARILLVDDQPNNLLALEAILNDAGLELVRAQSGEQALSRVLDQDYAAILMDVQMPGLDGFETAELIRDRDRSRHTPILFLTAFQSNDEQIERGYALGAVDFLAKPIIPAVLKAKVAVFVELFQKTEQVKRQAARLVENQRHEHERTLAEERQRWEVERLRAEAAREKGIAEGLARHAEELTRTIADRVRAEERLQHRVAQQAIVAELGQKALAGTDLAGLLDEVVAAVASSLDVRFSRVMELADSGDQLLMRAGFGWRPGHVGHEQVGAGPASLAGFTLHSNDPVVLEDLRTEDRFPVPDLLREHGVVSGLSVIIQGRERPFGTLGAYTEEPRTFSQDDIYFLQAVANILAAAIQRRRDEEELGAVRDELAVQLAEMTRLHALSERLSNSIELPAVLEEVLSAVTGLQGTDRGALVLYDRESDTMMTAASLGLSAEELAMLEQSPLFTQPTAGLATVKEGATIPPHPDLPQTAAGDRPWYHSASGTPLLTCGGDLVGVIVTDSSRLEGPSDRASRLVELYVRQAAEFIDNARLYREIREADRRKGEFLAMLGHELRNPLAPILNALHLLRLLEVGRDDLDQALDIAERQARHLARLVDDLLDVSRINSGKIELRKGLMNLRDAINGAIEAARPLIEARGHALAVSVAEEAIPLEADAARLEQVLANLLNNAAKYTEPGGRIALEAGREGQDAVILVRDSGVGIDPALLPHVFGMFIQADQSLDRSQGGLGIGLTLVRSLVELHGGTVSARSEGLGRGSEFVVTLPIAANAAPSRLEDRDRLAERLWTEPTRILIVDDNVDGARMMARLLKAKGSEVRVASDGPSALEAVRSYTPDLLLLDIGLPGMDGYEVARRLRQIPGLDRTLLVALTGYGQADDRRRALEVGFDDHLVKPVGADDLLPLLERGRVPEPEKARNRSTALGKSS